MVIIPRQKIEFDYTKATFNFYFIYFLFFKKESSIIFIIVKNLTTQITLISLTSFSPKKLTLDFQNLTFCLSDCFEILIPLISMNAPTFSLQFTSNLRNLITTPSFHTSTPRHSKSRGSSFGCHVSRSIDAWSGLSNDESATTYSESCSKSKENWWSGNREEEETWRRRKVECEVEVISWRERRIRAQTCVNADIHAVWRALTDYERLADFIPNLVSR